jgi:hypothetical protein
LLPKLYEKDTPVAKIFWTVYKLVFMANPNWKPGVVTNPNGRPIGARNARTTEVINKLIKNGFKDPLIILSELSQTSESEQIRAHATHMLAPYLHSKVAVAPAPIFISRPVTLPHSNPTKLDQVRENIIFLTNLKLSGGIDTTIADNLIDDQRHLHDSIFETQTPKCHRLCSRNLHPYNGRVTRPTWHTNHRPINQP